MFELYCKAFYPDFIHVFSFMEGMGFGEIALLRNSNRYAVRSFNRD